MVNMTKIAFALMIILVAWFYADVVIEDDKIAAIQYHITSKDLFAFSKEYQAENNTDINKMKSESDVDDIDAILKAADLLERRHNYHEAIKEYGKVIQKNPSSYEAYIGRGRAYGRYGCFDESFADLSKAIELDPKNYRAYMIRGEVNNNLEKYDSAIIDLAKACELKTGNEDVHTLYTNCMISYYYLKQYDKCWEMVHKMEDTATKVDFRILDALEQDSGISQEESRAYLKNKPPKELLERIALANKKIARMQIKTNMELSMDASANNIMNIKREDIMFINADNKLLFIEQKLIDYKMNFTLLAQLSATYEFIRSYGQDVNSKKKLESVIANAEESGRIAQREFDGSMARLKSEKTFYGMSGDSLYFYIKGYWYRKEFPIVNIFWDLASKLQNGNIAETETQKSLSGIGENEKKIYDVLTSMFSSYNKGFADPATALTDDTYGGIACYAIDIKPVRAQELLAESMSNIPDAANIKGAIESAKSRIFISKDSLKILGSVAYIRMRAAEEGSDNIIDVRLNSAISYEYPENDNKIPDGFWNAKLVKSEKQLEKILSRR